FGEVRNRRATAVFAFERPAKFASARADADQEPRAARQHLVAEEELIRRGRDVRGELRDPALEQLAAEPDLAVGVERLRQRGRRGELVAQVAAYRPPCAQPLALDVFQLEAVPWEQPAELGGDRLELWVDRGAVGHRHDPEDRHLTRRAGILRTGLGV